MHVDEAAGVPVEVADVYCDPVVQPPDLNACHVACPGTCVLGPWSDWSDCPQVCTIVVFSQISLCLEYKMFYTSIMKWGRYGMIFSWSKTFIHFFCAKLKCCLCFELLKPLSAIPAALATRQLIFFYLICS